MVQNTCIGSAGIEGVIIWHISPKRHLNFINLAQIFHRKLSSYQTLILYWLDLLRKPIKHFNFPGFGARLSPPQIRKYQVYPYTTNLKLFFNFAYVLTIIEDILGPFGALHI